MAQHVMRADLSEVGGLPNLLIRDPIVHGDAQLIDVLLTSHLPMAKRGMGRILLQKSERLFDLALQINGQLLVEAAEGAGGLKMHEA